MNLTGNRRCVCIIRCQCFYIFVTFLCLYSVCFMQTWINSQLTFWCFWKILVDHPHTLTVSAHNIKCNYNIIILNVSCECACRPTLSYWFHIHIDSTWSHISYVHMIKLYYEKYDKIIKLFYDDIIKNDKTMIIMALLNMLSSCTHFKSLLSACILHQHKDKRIPYRHYKYQGHMGKKKIPPLSDRPTFYDITKVMASWITISPHTH